MIEELYISIFSKEVSYLSSFIKILISFILGVIIGLERQSRRQNAGMRTISLICMASTSAMILSIWIPQTYSSMFNGDPGRLAAQVLTGVGFLGAGAIIQSKGNVRGLTTAATIWLVSIIGLCVGAGLYIPAIVLTLLSLFVLVTMDRYEKKKMIVGDIKNLIIMLDDSEPDVEYINNILRKYSIYIFDTSIENNYKLKTSIISYKIQIPQKENVNNLFNEIRKNEFISSICLNSL